MQLDDFFGLDFSIKKFDINILLDLLSIKRKIEEVKIVTQISKKFGKHSPFVQLAKRQQTLNYFKPFLSAEFLPFDQSYYKREVNTASDKDRRYNCEERVLEYALLVASGKSTIQLKAEEYKPNLKILRHFEGGSPARFDCLWEVMTKEAKDVIADFQKALESK